jgi:hypothetical protein
MATLVCSQSEKAVYSVLKTASHTYQVTLLKATGDVQVEAEAQSLDVSHAPLFNLCCFFFHSLTRPLGEFPFNMRQRKKKYNGSKLRDLDQLASSLSLLPS